MYLLFSLEDKNKPFLLFWLLELRCVFGRGRVHTNAPFLLLLQLTWHDS